MEQILSNIEQQWNKILSNIKQQWNKILSKLESQTLEHQTQCFMGISTSLKNTLLEVHLNTIDKILMWDLI